MRFHKIVVILFFIFLLSSYFLVRNVFSATQIDNNSIRFLSLADIHFDPFSTCRNAIPCPLILKLNQSPASEWPKLFTLYETETPHYQADSNYQLLKSALDAAKLAAETEHAQFVIALGDFLGHGFYKAYKKYSRDKSIAAYQAFVKKTIEFLTMEFSRTFPSIDVYTIIGNNDSYQGDYFFEQNGRFFTDANNLWSSLIKNKKNRASMQHQFSTSGYYAVDLPNQPQLKLIVLNSVLFSTNAKGKTVNQAANDQMRWLHQQLELLKAAQQKAFIAMHIPMGTDIYATFRIRFFRLIELWKPQYTQQFEAELEKHAKQVAGIFVGHLHSDWFQYLNLDQVEIPMTGTSSISPIFGNKPGFKIYTYAPQSDLLKELVTYYYPLGSKIWNKEFSLNRGHKCKKCSVLEGKATTA